MPLMSSQLVLLGVLVSGSPIAFASSLPECAIEFELKGCPSVVATTTPDEAMVSGHSPGGAGNAGGETSPQTAPAEPPTEQLAPMPPRTPGAPTTVESTNEMQSMDVGDDVLGPSIERGPWEIIEIGLDDIASFRPGGGGAFMEPGGWTIRGLPTNFWTVASTQIIGGELLDRPASVRFTPVQYRWNFGDGAKLTRSSAGEQWESLGVEEFAETLTSHSYAKSGTYVVQPSVDYSAEYQLGAGEEWIAITGVVTARSNPLTVVVTGASTVLIAKDCRADPGGPGC